MGGWVELYPNYFWIFVNFAKPLTLHQGCPIGIPKNPEISGSRRKSLLGAAEEVHSARAKYRGVWAAVFTFNPYLLISINELLISIIHLLISIKMAPASIFIDIYNSFIDINK